MSESVPVLNFDPGFIDCVVHTLSGAQVLFYLFHIWENESIYSTVIWCNKGETSQKVNAIRVALSKERAARSLPRTFELRFSESWPYTHNGIKGEAVKITRHRGSNATRIRAAFVTLANRGKHHGK